MKAEAKAQCRGREAIQERSFSYGEAVLKVLSLRIFDDFLVEGVGTCFSPEFPLHSEFGWGRGVLTYLLAVSAFCNGFDNFGSTSLVASKRTLDPI